MKIKFSPCQNTHDSLILVLDANSLRIDGEKYEFAADDVQWEDIHAQTSGIILEAKRVEGILQLVVLRFYKDSCSEWDTGEFQEVNL